MLAHGGGAERAVEADGERAGMADRVPERGRRLARERAAGAVGDGAGDHHRQPAAALGERLLAGEDRRLGVQRVEDGLDQEQVGAAVDQPADLLGVGIAQLVEGDGAEAGIVDVGRHRGGAVGRPERAGDEARLAVVLLGFERRAPGEPRAVAVQLVDDVLHAVIGLGDAGRGEGVGLENVGAGLRIGEVDRLDRLGLGQRQQVVVALQVAGAGGEALAAEMCFFELEALHLGPHRAVEHEDALGRLGAEQRLAVGGRGEAGEQVGHGASLGHNRINISLCR